MKQVVRSLGTGQVRVAEVPAPQLRPGGVLVRTRYSVLSPGTERMKVEQGRRSLLGKALDRPDDVKRVLDTVRREGPMAAFHKVRGKLDSLTTLGYAAAGVVEGVGAGVTRFQVGDRVACAGEGYAAHAEVLWVPEQLAVPVPDEVPLDDAAFATLGAIALHGVRQADVRLGEFAVVVGLGLIGQLTVQLLVAAGVRVLGVDVLPARVELARALSETLIAGTARAGFMTPGGGSGASTVDARVRALTGGVGADAVLLTATTKRSGPMEIATQVTRDRARIVVVGQVPIEASRGRFQAKELELKTSRSYGPGRYDPSYELNGVDYPVGYVRWTENRNLEAFLALAAQGALNLKGLVTHRVPFAEAESAYETLTGPAAGDALGVLLAYEAAPVQAGAHTPGSPGPQSMIALQTRSAPRSRPPGSPVRLGFIGAGNFAVGTLLPALDRLKKSYPITFQAVTTAGGTSALAAGERFGFHAMAASPEALFAAPDIDAVVIATRHADHARLAAAALDAGKSVYLEKPLALTQADLELVLESAQRAEARGAFLQVGFNRRFAPATLALIDALKGVTGPRVVQIRVNAGAIAADSWIHDAADGGGRILGEACHFVDLGLQLAGALPVEVQATYLGGQSEVARLRDNAQITLRCADGSLVSVLYTAIGDPSTGKERVEVFAGGGTALLDDFRRLELVGLPLASSGSKRGARGWKGAQDKGHGESLRRFVKAIAQGESSPTPLDTLEATTRATLLASEPSGPPHAR